MIATVAAVLLSVMPLLPLASSSKILAPRWGLPLSRNRVDQARLVVLGLATPGSDALISASFTSIPRCVVRVRLRRVQSSGFGFGGGARRGSLPIGADIFPRMSYPRRSSTPTTFEATRPRQARELFNLGLVHFLEYGVASADLKPSTLWAGSRFTVGI